MSALTSKEIRRCHLCPHSDIKKSDFPLLSGNWDYMANHHPQIWGRRWHQRVTAETCATGNADIIHPQEYLYDNSEQHGRLNKNECEKDKGVLLEVLRKSLYFWGFANQHYIRFHSKGSRSVPSDGGRVWERTTSVKCAQCSFVGATPFRGKSFARPWSYLQGGPFSSCSLISLRIYPKEREASYTSAPSGGKVIVRRHRPLNDRFNHNYRTICLAFPLQKHH